MAKRRVDIDDLAVAAIGGRVASNVANSTSNSAMMSVLERNSNASGSISRREMAALKKDVGARGVPVMVRKPGRFDSLRGPQPSFYAADVPSEALKLIPGTQRRAAAKRRGVVSLDTRRTSTAAHELGHASGKAKKLNLRKKNYASAVFGSRRFGGVLGGIAGGIASGAASKDGESVSRTALQGAAAGAAGGLVGSAPVLFEEGRASLRGLKSLKNIGISRRRLVRSAIGMAAAFGTYAGAAAIPGAGLGMGASVAARGVKEQTKKARRFGS